MVTKTFAIQASEAALQACGCPMQIVAKARHYFGLHLQDPIDMSAVLQALGISQDCLNLSFGHVRGMTPAQALLEQRLNKLFAVLTDHPRQGLKRALRGCGLESTADVVALFEQTFGIEMPVFLQTCRRAADDRLFRRAHPEPSSLVLPT
ncbi:hypothetical protein [Vulcanococcus sp.]|uniref:hypothetical protein n=1 Tax=Vulcanococcus sp. TaxID=2856995 RepID=UPI003C01C723